MHSSTSQSIFRLLAALLLFSSLFFPSSNAQVIKGCPFDGIYSLGVKDSSPSGSHRGSLMTDQIATAFHLPSPKDYTGEQYGRLHYGASFATQNAIALGKPFLEEQGIHIPSYAFTDSITSQQVSFSTYLDSFCFINRLECREKLQRSLFTVDLGSNDYKYALLNGKSVEQVEEYVPVISSNIVNLVSEIKKEGASNILVPGMLPLGCIPGYVSLLHSTNPGDFDADNCHIGLNNLAKNHNDQLKLAISQEWPHGPYAQSQAFSEIGDSVSYSQVLYADYYNAFMALLRDKSHHSRPLFHTDGFHLTEEANEFIAGKLISGNGFLQPEIHLPKVTHCLM